MEVEIDRKVGKSNNIIVYVNERVCRVQEEEERVSFLLGVASGLRYAIFSSKIIVIIVLYANWFVII